MRPAHWVRVWDAVSIYSAKRRMCEDWKRATGSILKRWREYLSSKREPGLYCISHLNGPRTRVRRKRSVSSNNWLKKIVQITSLSCMLRMRETLPKAETLRKDWGRQLRYYLI